MNINGNGKMLSANISGLWIDFYLLVDLNLCAKLSTTVFEQ